MQRFALLTLLALALLAPIGANAQSACADYSFDFEEIKPVPVVTGSIITWLSSPGNIEIYADPVDGDPLGIIGDPALGYFPGSFTVPSGHTLVNLTQNNDSGLSTVRVCPPATATPSPASTPSATSTATIAPSASATPIPSVVLSPGDIPAQMEALAVEQASSVWALDGWGAFFLSLAALSMLGALVRWLGGMITWRS